MREENLTKIDESGKRRASLTVEASILIPFALFVIVGGINIGYDLFQQAKNASQIQEELEKLNPVEIVQKNMLMHGIKKGGEENRE